MGGAGLTYSNGHCGCGADVPSRALQSPSLGPSMHLKEKDIIFHMEYSHQPAGSPSDAGSLDTQGLPITLIQGKCSYNTVAQVSRTGEASMADALHTMIHQGYVMGAVSHSGKTAVTMSRANRSHNGQYTGAGRREQLVPCNRADLRPDMQRSLGKAQICRMAAQCGLKKTPSHDESLLNPTGLLRCDQKTT